MNAKDINAAASWRVAILDNRPIVRLGLIACLAQGNDISIVGEYETGLALIEGLRDKRAHLAVIEYSLGPDELDGSLLIQRLRNAYPQLRVLVTSTRYDLASVASALRSGAHGFLGKSADERTVPDAVRKIAAGGVYIEPGLSRKLSGLHVGRLDSTDMAAADEILHRAALSLKESEVIRCFLDGMSIMQIAEKFARSPKTISTQKAAAYRKLGVTTDNGLFKLLIGMDHAR